MDSFQGSIPPTFISFYLDNQTPEIGTSPNPSELPLPASTEDATNASRNVANPQISSQNTDSDEDVNAYAEAKASSMETGILQVQEQSGVNAKDTELSHAEIRSSQLETQPMFPIRASTPIPLETAGTSQASLTALESGLRVADPIGSQLPELLITTPTKAIVPISAASTTDDGCESSVYKVPALPTQEHKVRFLTDLSEAEKTAEESSNATCPSLYGGIPNISESGAETIDPPDLTITAQEQLEPEPSTSRGTGYQLSELSGRARAILKTYFDETNAFRLPPGQTTMTFSEPQVYHLLRVLSDETLRMSYTTIERMILDAVRGSPTIAPSRTGHFQLGARAQTPYRYASSDSSDAESGQLPIVDSEDQSATDFGGLGDSSTFGESDSAEEMALISATFEASNNRSAVKATSLPAPGGLIQVDSQETDFSSQDATLSEVRDQTLGIKGKQRGKKASKPKKVPQRGVPMREEFFAKIGWTRSFISGPADPLHKPYMVWCHICKKNFSIRTKGTMEILRHHRTERHLRRDQRWRYEHLKSTDPVTLKTQHRVRGKNGKILTRLESAKELPKFIHAGLVDIGERFPFYEDFIRGRTTPLVTPESRARTQLCMVADFIQHHGDIAILRNMWAKISSFTDHQAALCDFDWGEERMTVSTTFSLYLQTPPFEFS